MGFFGCMRGLFCVQVVGFIVIGYFGCLGYAGGSSIVIIIVLVGFVLRYVCTG